MTWNDFLTALQAHNLIVALVLTIWTAMGIWIVDLALLGSRIERRLVASGLVALAAVVAAWPRRRTGPQPDAEDAFTKHEWAELRHGFAADAYRYRAGGLLPGETRTNFTRKDYKS